VKKTIKGKIISVVLCLIALVFALPTIAFAQTGVSREAEEHILNELSRARIPNAAIAIIQNGETSFIFKDSAQDTIFQIGSIGKSFTGFGVLVLEEMGLISAYDTVNQHLPWFEVSYNGTPVPHEDIRIYHLLQNASGLMRSLTVHWPELTESTDNYISRKLEVGLAFYPGERHGYSDFNSIILGLLIEAISGQSYDEFMTQHVLHPLGMYNTFTDNQRVYETGRVIGGNRLRFLQATPFNPPVNPIVIPAGVIYSTITDMARWAEIHLGTADIPEQFARVVQRSHEDIGALGFFAHGNYIYASGWNVLYDGSRVRHNGSTQNYSASLRTYPHDNRAVMVLTNIRGEGVQFGAFISGIAFEGEPLGSVHTMSMDAILDIIFTVAVIIGIVYIGFFIRFIIKAVKRLNSGEKTKRKPSFKIVWLIAPIIIIADLVITYMLPSVMSNMPHHLAVEFIPASYTPALIILWAMLICSLCVFFARVFGLSAKKINKVEE